MRSVLPPRLRPGARVALVAPAGPVPDDGVEAALARCRQFGFEPVPGESARAHTGYLAGPDAARLADLRRAFGDPEIDAVWALRGGYGVLRLLPALDEVLASAPPRVFIGFSDNTALLLALARHGRVGFHGPHARAAFPPLTEAAFRAVLCAGAAAGPLPLSEPPCVLVPGRAEGRLAGGNLALLAAACGTPWALRGAGCIVFLEDVGEPAYRVDRMLTQLLLSGCLEGAAGIAAGRFTGGEATEAEVHAVLEERLSPLGVPVLARLPIGHVDENWTLPVGARARLDGDGITLLEAAVS
jgi:muramoyltetrapeptide carboxypeptidase